MHIHVYSCCTIGAVISQSQLPIDPFMRLDFLEILPLSAAASAAVASAAVASIAAAVVMDECQYSRINVMDGLGNFSASV